MRVVLDECVDRRLSHDIVGHEVRTARRMDWTAIGNGELLALAASRNGVFVRGFAILLIAVPGLLATRTTYMQDAGG